MPFVLSIMFLLCLFFSYLNGNNFRQLPPVKLDAVTDLDLSNNQLAKLPDIQAAKLEHINITFNYIKEIPSSYNPKQLPSLKSLFVSS